MNGGTFNSLPPSGQQSRHTRFSLLPLALCLYDALRSMNRRIFTRSLLLLILCLSCGRLTHAQTTQSPLPPPTSFVNDYANVIDPATKTRLETILKNLRDEHDIEFAVVTVPTTGDQDIFDYTLAVARGWGIGSKEGDQAGLILLVAINDHKYQTQVSRHLEGDLPDGLLGQIQRERLVPPFKQGNYSQGISDTVETYVATLGEKRGFSIAGIDQKRAYHPRQRSSGSSGSGFSPCGIAFIILIVLIFILSNRRRGGGGGCVNLLLLNTLFNAMGSSRRSSSGWGGGGFGGTSSGSGGFSDFGGFGGGGDFGGGGAGGSW